MILIKSDSDINQMRKAGKLAAEVLEYLKPMVKAGVTTESIHIACDEYTRSKGAISAPLNYNGFPKSLCTSINNVVCHGIPSNYSILKDGDIVNIDVTVKLNGYHGDTSKTFLIGEVAEATRLLVERTEAAMWKGIEAVKDSAYFGDIGDAIESFIKPFGYGIVRDLCGHGIGKQFHEDPMVLHYKTKERGKRMKAGMIFTIEPMINMGSFEVYTDENDGWTVYTKDKSLSAQFEHTVLCCNNGYEILTQ